MLVLDRKLREKIHIDVGITITVLRIQGNRVCLGIEAPDDVRVVRGELLGLRPQETGRLPRALASR
jgi:carbon storage regulator